MDGLPIPYLTEHVPPIGGRIRSQPEDFVVEELGVPPPSGHGSFTMALVEKRGMSTPGLVRLIATRLGVGGKAIGVSGLKDTAAISRQWVSVADVEPDRVQSIEHPQLLILRVARHDKKLRLGSHTDNRFTIRVRGVEPDAPASAERVASVMIERGMPNVFGPQRFGTHGRAHRIGKAFLVGDLRQALDLYLGRPSEEESDKRLREARAMYDAGDFAGALYTYPSSRWAERQLLEKIVEGADLDEVFGTLPVAELRFQLSAYQSFLFNQVLARRLPRIDTAEEGDIVRYADSMFDLRVSSKKLEEVKGPVERFNASPTGPMFGYRMALAKGEQGRLELEMLAAEGIVLKRFKVNRHLKYRGDRRPFRIRPEGLKVLEEEGDLILKFTLPKGVFATALLREMMKKDVR